MAEINTLRTENVTYTYDEYQKMLKNDKIDTSGMSNVSIFTKSNDPNACTDGNDDGHISGIQMLKSEAKGIGQGIKGLFTDENGKFSFGKTLKSLCFGPGTIVGAINMGVSVANGAIALRGAKTDGEKKAAIESMYKDGLSGSILDNVKTLANRTEKVIDNVDRNFHSDNKMTKKEIFEEAMRDDFADVSTTYINADVEKGKCYTLLDY